MLEMVGTAGHLSARVYLQRRCVEDAGGLVVNGAVADAYEVWEEEVP